MPAAVKARTIAALRGVRLKSNLWAVLAQWKEKRTAPEQFKALIVGPPKTFKTTIGLWIQVLWPQAQFDERWVTGARQLEPLPYNLADVAGFPLIIRTFRHEVAANGVMSHWEYATIPKCRWTATDPAKHYDIMPRMRTRER